MEKKFSKFKILYKGHVIVELNHSIYCDEEFKKEVLLAVRNKFLSNLSLAYKEDKVWKNEQK
jgi:hypothetical protein